MKILLPVDGSATSRAALKAFRERPWPADSTVRLLTVVPAIVLPEAAAVDYERVLQHASEHAAAVNAAAVRDLGEIGLPVEAAVRHGDPRHAIVEEAESWGADLIVLGSHGRTGLERALMGSAAEYVVRHAPCSVEVARDRGAAR
jgi:nucleotide-binding universal stress UspA family protein